MKLFSSNLFRINLRLNNKIDMLDHDIKESEGILKSRSDEIERLQNYSMTVTNEVEVLKEQLLAASMMKTLKYRFSTGKIKEKE